MLLYYILIMMSLVSFFAVVYLLIGHLKSPSKGEDCLDERAMLDDLIDCIVNRSVDFDTQRETVHQKALRYKTELESGEKQNKEATIVQFSLMRKNQYRQHR